MDFLLIQGSRPNKVEIKDAYGGPSYFLETGTWYAFRRRYFDDFETFVLLCVSHIAHGLYLVSEIEGGEFCSSVDVLHAFVWEEKSSRISCKNIEGFKNITVCARHYYDNADGVSKQLGKVHRYDSCEIISRKIAGEVMSAAMQHFARMID